jgi:ABC-2 type transport system permease protein
MSAIGLAGVQPGSSIWRYVIKLMRLRWVILYSSFRRAKLRGKIGMFVLLLLLLGGLAFAFWLSWLLLGFLRSPQLGEFVGDVGQLLASVPVLVVTAAFIGILVTSFGVLLQALYLAGDMDFLLSTPVPVRAVFIAKMLQAILPNFGLILLFGLPVLYGLGASGGFNILYYPLVLVELALLALAASGMASLLVMAVVRIVPARRVAEVLGFVVAIFSFTCSQSGQFVNYGDVSSDQATQALGVLTRFNNPWSPLSWAGRGLVDIGEGRWLSGVGLVLLTLVLTAGVFAVSLVTAERLYFSGWARVQVSATKKKKAARSPGRATLGGTGLAILVERFVPPAVRGIMTKDFLVLRRDLRSMSQLVTPLILGVVYAFMLVRRGGEPPVGRGEAPPMFMEVLSNLLVYGNVGIALFVSWSLLSRLAMMGFSSEGKNYWLLKSAPVSRVKLIASKYLVAYLPTLALGIGFLVIISLVQRTSPGTLVFSLLVVALAIAGTAGLNLAFGVRGAKFDWEDPRKISQGGAGCLGALASVVFLGVSLVLFFGPSLLVGVFGGPEAVGQLVGLLLGGAFCLVGVTVPLWLVRNRVDRLAEE